MRIARPFVPSIPDIPDDFAKGPGARGVHRIPKLESLAQSHRLHFSRFADGPMVIGSSATRGGGIASP